MNMSRHELTGRPLNLAAYAVGVNHLNQKWWHDPKTGDKIARNKKQMLMLMLSEVAECMEGERKNLADDKLPHRRMAEVEMADTAIRLLDYAAGWGNTLKDVVATSGYVMLDTMSMSQDDHATDETKKPFLLFSPEKDRGEMLFNISEEITGIGIYIGWGDDIDETDGTNHGPFEDDLTSFCLSNALHSIECYCHVCGYDLWGAVAEKLDYNQTRVDHSHAHRIAEGGKLW